MMAYSLTSPELESLHATFLALDNDRSGTISLADLRRAVNSKLKVTDEELQRLFCSMDQTHDNEVHYSEFIAAVMQTRLRLHADLLRETFDRIDVGKTGVITGDDLRRVFNKAGQQEVDDKDIVALIRECGGSPSQVGITFDNFVEHLQCSTACESKRQVTPDCAADCDMPVRIRSSPLMRAANALIDLELERSISSSPRGFEDQRKSQRIRSPLIQRIVSPDIIRVYSGSTPVAAAVEDKQKGPPPLLLPDTPATCTADAAAAGHSSSSPPAVCNLSSSSSSIARL